MNAMNSITSEKSYRIHPRRDATTRLCRARSVLGALIVFLVVLPAVTYGAGVGSWRGVYTGGAAKWGRAGASAVWTGSEMIYWGGGLGSNVYADGSVYNPVTNRWRHIDATPTVGLYFSRAGHSAVWTGTEMIVWGGKAYPGSSRRGARYNPATNRWREISRQGAPSDRQAHVAVWTGEVMIVWGGTLGNPAFRNGGIYNPSIDAWQPLETTNAPSARGNATAVWTGSEMLVWGGGRHGAPYLGNGGRYSLSQGWAPMSTDGAPAPRTGHTAVWTGEEMVVWSGYRFVNYQHIYYRGGKRYDPATDSWTGMTLTGAPAGRIEHSAVWDGARMIVWGGYGYGSVSGGGLYDPDANSWKRVATDGAPGPRYDHVAVWAEELGEMIVWGGRACRHWTCFLKSGGRYEPPAAGPTDGDEDGVSDDEDNCPDDPNPGQEDNDNDGAGDVCDPDDDNDSVPDGEDNCPWNVNPQQTNTDGDELGDICDPDDDNDGVDDGADNCRLEANPGQEDNDGDGLGDACDPDDDDDGVDDEVDNCPLAVNPLQEDFDLDGLGDVCDPDDDDDGLPDDADGCPFEHPAGADADVDGCVDLVDDLADLILGLNLPQGLENSLLAKVEGAIAALEDGNVGAAINKLEALIHQVEAQRGKKISAADADLLIAFVQNVIAGLS